MDSNTQTGLEVIEAPTAPEEGMSELGRFIFDTGVAMMRESARQIELEKQFYQERGYVD